MSCSPASRTWGRWCWPCTPAANRCSPRCAPGARGYLVKGADKAELILPVLAAADGQAVHGAPVARRIAKLSGTARPATPAFPDLTPREREVPELLADGARNSQIARHLGMTDKTIRNHVSAILMKLQVPDRTAAAIKARDAR